VQQSAFDVKLAFVTRWLAAVDGHSHLYSYTAVIFRRFIFRIRAVAVAEQGVKVGQA